LSDLSQIFREGGTPEGLPSPIKRSKDPPKLLPVSLYLKGKVRVWGTPNHLKWDFGAKNSKKTIPYPKV